MAPSKRQRKQNGQQKNDGKSNERTAYTNKKSINQSTDSDRLKQNRIENCINNHREKKYEKEDVENKFKFQTSFKLTRLKWN